MFEKIKAKLIFGKLLSRPNIEKAYAMVGPEDSWYNTIKKVLESLEEIQKLPHQTLDITSSDGLNLRGIYYPAEKESDKTVICIHGFGSHAEREWAFPGLFYHSLGFNVLIPYQRAHGISEGKKITFGMLESFDIIKWIGKVQEITPDSQILIHGLSMGGGIALELSDTNELPCIKGIISDAPTPSVEAFFYNVSHEIFGKGGEAVAKCAIDDLNKYTGLEAKNFNFVETVKDSVHPLLLSAGSMEKLEDLFDKIKQNNTCDTEIIILDGCNHGNGMYKQTEAYQTKIKEFIDRYFD
jgi:pimeloyl-ACP methyl ester carboxylesterase